ncbi:peptide deformylase [Flavobacteriaceae bacterium KMM 6898]|nr:peptide deformylase [Flavobacteriaceae bacterium KMM 6898]
MFKKFILLLFFLGLLVSCSNTRQVIAESYYNNFSEEQIEMIMSGEENEPMRVFKINNKQDSILLRTKSEALTIDPNDPVLQRFVERLYSTVRDSMSLGAGIAAPQVGILKNIIWVQRFDKENLPFEVYLNPKITKYSKLKQDCLEGCLSIPKRRDTTKTRAYAVLFEYDKLDNTHATEMVEAFTAVIVQHEVDHLNGILYLDHLEKEAKDVTHQ